jgi:mRNA interferase MazF
MGKTRLPTHIDIYAERAGLARDSVILLEQIRTLDKRRLKEKMGHLDEGLMNEVNAAIAVSFGLGVAAAQTSLPAASAATDGSAIG